MASLLERVRDALAPHYVVERELGAGGMGVVFLARDTRLDRMVAIKVLRPELATAVAVERFSREARLLARLHHSTIVRVYLADDTAGFSYYVMEYVEGETLKTRLEAGPLPPRTVRALGRALLDALGAAHRLEIVHRDVKPANIFLLGDRTLHFVEAWDTHEWPQREAPSGEVDVVAGALARLHRAELAAAAGRMDISCALAVRVGALWEDAEPGYAELRRRAGALAKRCA